MAKKHITLLGKAVQKVAALRGGGSALPGLVVEKLDPHFLSRTLRSLPMGVVVISGTNGKTTTTKMVVALLESQGLRVFTNRTGSNFTRGVVAALLQEIDLDGQLHADIAVLELDEAHAVQFVASVAPRYTLLLNVMRDQLDRFGEIDNTAKLLKKIADSTSHGLVLNSTDPRIRAIAETITGKQINFFGLGKEVRPLFPSDDELYHTKLDTPINKNEVELSAISDDTVTFTIDKKPLPVKLKITGAYNFLNAAAALAFTRMIIPSAQRDDAKLMAALQQVTPAFGRGEVLMVNGQPLELILVKNPAGFRLALQSFLPEKNATMIAINDNYADGRDMSWLWDVDFSSLRESGVAVVSGVRAYDMALRLQYDEVEIGDVDTSLEEALATLLAKHPEKPKRIFCTYTAMLALRRKLKKLTTVEHIS
ncbi:MAG TPA: MurT ligase domain-containing protein [Verrucomicrobiae bacterium]|nr:MurT ligase domain-containing protein [Verrucomicrobiae bacterium]